MWDDYAKSVGKSTNELTKQEKITAEVNGILEETKFQVGDAAKYADTFAGRTARLSQTFYTLKNTIGEVIMPIANLFIPVIQKAMESLVRFFNTVKTVMGALGFDMSTSISNTSSAYDALGDSASSSANDIVEASKKASKAVMGYDELNILKKSDNSSSNGSSSTSTISDTLDGSNVQDTITPKIQSIVDKCKKAFSSLWNSKEVKTFGSSVSTILDFYIQYWGTLFFGFKKDIQTTWSNVSDDMSNIWGNLSFLWVDFWDSLQSTVDTYGPQIIENVSSLFSSIWLSAIDPNIQIITQAWSDFTNNLVSLWNEYSQPLADNIALFITNITDTFGKIWTDIMNPIITPFLTMVKDLWNSHFKEMFNQLSEFVLNAINSWLTLYNKFGKPIIDFLIEIFGPVISNVFKSAWNVIGTVCGFIIDTVSNVLRVFNGVIDFITGVFTGDWKRAWDGIKNIFGGTFGEMTTLVKSPLNLILDGVENFLNKIITGFNNFKRILNKFKISIPDWLGGGTFGFNLDMSSNVSLPRLANGGWVEPNKPRTVIVGDNKREGEIIAPESKIYEQAKKANEDSKSVNKTQLEITLIHKYPDGRYMIHEINDTQIKDGKITLLT